MVKDVVCGMDVNPKTAKYKAEKQGKTYYFCSKNCWHTFLKHGIIRKNIVSIGLSLLLVLIAVGVMVKGYMLVFMGIVFLILSGLKLIDVKGFALRFQQYDILAKKVKLYSFVYPFIELGLAVMFLFNFLINIAALITVLIMGVGVIGVTKNAFRKDKIKCACLGAKIKVPLTLFTIVEDLVMFLMGLIILLGLF